MSDLLIIVYVKDTVKLCAFGKSVGFTLTPPVRLGADISLGDVVQVEISRLVSPEFNCPKLPVYLLTRVVKTGGRSAGVIIKAFVAREFGLHPGGLVEVGIRRVN